ncbi:MAG: L,D-transpeptidase family protein [Actinomycetota bacterium]|nr:L,D-transpeptidase family protein [Actinomycetota bacterium]
MALAATLGLVACGGGSDRAGGGLSIMAHGRLDPATSTTTPSSTSTTITSPSPTTTEAPPPPGLGPGATGPVVASIEQKLASLHYEVGAVDDTYDQDTAYAVTAFQKVTGAQRTGRATDDVVAAIGAANTAPGPLVAGGGPTRVEIDLDRQVLFLYESDTLAKILTVSTGSGKRFCSEGYCRRAITETGSFRVYRQAQGWEEGPLGSLYNPSYFDGGIAIHGATSVPASPASHGCVRIPMHAAEWFPSHIPFGTPVYVAGPDGVPGPLPETPPDTVAPPEGPPVTAVTTTVPRATTTTTPGIHLFKP